MLPPFVWVPLDTALIGSTTAESFSGQVPFLPLLLCELLASGGGSFQCWGVCSSRVLQPSKENRTKDRCRKLLFSLLPNSAGFCQL